MTDAFTRFDDADVRDLVAEFPLAWVAARDPGSSPGEASLLPLLGEYDATGRLVALLGHLGRHNPLHARLAASPGATILFNGPHGYISPAQARLRDWGPTWNYAQLAIAADIVFEPDGAHEAIAALVDAMEGDGWSSAELGDRYAGMAGAIVAFRARVTAVTGRFKLGQDEGRPVFDAIVRNHPDAALVRWMRRFDR
ncbi:FMN-binding negative transcriptional regulator [Sphingomonas bacterium]|uniref:FMN-binding negative transcriptional regulator n=1 Tax=Sphingomonas bacterium TaxID=1895847 RepID=UPI0015766D95|nr:FMN-binding negative transcriptional regulator [Sphingomonas bacterium]